MVAFLGDHQVLDLSAVTDKSLAASTPGIGGFDLGGHHNALVISLSDVLTLGEQDLFIDDGKHQLIVNGKEGDSVDLQNSHVPGLSDGEWRHNGTAEVGGVFITWLNIQARTPNCWLSTQYESKCINRERSVSRRHSSRPEKRKRPLSNTERPFTRFATTGLKRANYLIRFASSTALPTYEPGVMASSNCFASSGIASPLINVCKPSRVMPLPRVSSFNCSYGFSTP